MEILELGTELFRSRRPNIRSGRLDRPDPSRSTSAGPFRERRIRSGVPSCHGESIPTTAVAANRGIMSHPAGALEELHREHELAERLLERLAEIGERVKSGERADPKAVRFGLGLLDAYLHRVHAYQEDRELLPEAR